MVEKSISQIDRTILSGKIRLSFVHVSHIRSLRATRCDGQSRHRSGGQGALSCAREKSIMHATEDARVRPNSTMRGHNWAFFLNSIAGPSSASRILNEPSDASANADDPRSHNTTTLIPGTPSQRCQKISRLPKAAVEGRTHTIESRALFEVSRSVKRTRTRLSIARLVVPSTTAFGSRG